MALITVTGNLKNISGGVISAGTVTFRLCNVGSAAIPRVSGTAVIPTMVVTATSNGSGAFSVQLYGNDVIAPTGTFYEVQVVSSVSTLVGPVAYQFNGSSPIDLTSATPLIAIPNGQLITGYTLSIGTVTSGAAAASITGTYPNQTLNLTLPTGPTGNTGATGAAATIAAGSTATGSPGTSALVVNSGSSSAAIFDFTIPQGAQGLPGATCSNVPAAWSSLTAYTTGQCAILNGDLWFALQSGTNHTPAIGSAFWLSLSNAQSIQGVSVTPTPPSAAGTQLVFNGTQWVLQAKRVVDVRDIIGVDCTGTTDSSAALNALTDGSTSTAGGAIISFFGCPTVRLDHIWWIKNFPFTPEINLGPRMGGTRIIGCTRDAAPTGLPYIPIILFSRTGQPTLDGGETVPGSSTQCGGVAGGATANIGVENDFTTNPAGVTCTRGIFHDHFFQSASNGIGPANWIGLVIGGSTINNQNVEGMRVENNTFAGHGEQGSIGLYIGSRNSDHGLCIQNLFQDSNYGVKTFGPWWTFMGNVYGGVADHRVFTPAGSVIYADCNNLAFINDEPAEGCGQFITEISGNNNLRDVQFIGGTLGGNDGGLAPGTSNIDVGAGGGTWHFIGTRGQNINGDPLVTFNAALGGQPFFHSVGADWITTFAIVDTTKGAYYDNIGDYNIGARVNTGLGFTLQTVLGGNHKSGGHCPPLNFEHTGQVSHAVSNYALTNMGADTNNTSGLQMVQTSGATGVIVQSPPYCGAVIVNASSTPAINTVTPIGATGATTWAYSIVAYAHNGSVYVYPTVSIANGVATLTGSNFNRIDVHTSAEFWKYCVRRETAGGVPNTTGLLSSGGPLGTGCLITPLLTDMNPPTWGQGGDQHIFFFDTGLAGDTLAAPAKTADGRVVAAGAVIPGTVTFATLPTPVNGMLIYCSDCTVASPCANGGTGALAKQINGVWVCN